MTDVVTNVDGRPLSQRGLDTRRRLLDAAEHVFGELGYHDASIVKLAEARRRRAGTFYLYFDSKKAIFDELVRDLNRRVRHAMKEGSSQGETRLESELLGFEAYFRFTAEHPGALPDHPPGRVRLAGDAPLPLRPALGGLRRGAREASVDSGEIGKLDPEVAAYRADGHRRADRHALDPLGRRQADARARLGRARAHHPLHPRGRDVRRVGLVATASYLPERWMTAAEVAERSGIPEQVIVEKFGLRGKHIAAPDEHVSDLSVRAVERLLEETGTDPKEIDVVMYYGSMWRDYPVWQVAPHIAHRLGATNAFAVEYDERLARHADRAARRARPAARGSRS